MNAEFNDSVKDYITAAADGVELNGICPICGTGRSQNGECWRGHIIIDTNNSQTIKVMRKNAAQQSAKKKCICTDFLHGKPDPVPNPTCQIHGHMK